MKEKIGIFILVVLIVVVVLIFQEYDNRNNYYVVVNDSSNCGVVFIHQDERRAYYLECLDELKIKRGNKKLSVSNQLKDMSITLEDILKDAKSHEDYVDGTIYRYDDFSILVCSKMIEDHVRPNYDVIFGKKDLDISSSKHCGAMVN